MNQARAAVAPDTSIDRKEKKKTAARTGIQQQKCFDMVVVVCVVSIAVAVVTVWS